MDNTVDFDQARMTTGAVLIEFYASWCPHCQRMMPIVDNVRELLGGQVPVYQYDIEQYPEAAQEAGVESIPTFIIYDNGVERWRHTGELSGDLLLAQVDNVMQLHDQGYYPIQ